MDTAPLDTELLDMDHMDPLVMELLAMEPLDMDHMEPLATVVLDPLVMVAMVAMEVMVAHMEVTEAMAVMVEDMVWVMV